MKFLYPTCIYFSVPTGVTPSEFRKLFDIYKSRVIGLPPGEETIR